MTWWNEYADQIELDAPLAPLTWYRLGGPAKYLFRPRDVESLVGLRRRACDAGVATKVLGGGANVLIDDDGFDGLVIRLDAPVFRSCVRRNGGVRVGAGADFMRLAETCSKQGWSGLEGMAAIPGTLGGAVRMNAGGRYGYIADVLHEATMLTHQGALETWTKDRFAFGYRKSAVGDATVVDATLNLQEDDPVRTSAAHQARFTAKRNNQPLQTRTAGCVFKNPPAQSAGRLIDEVGLKGATHGGARVSEDHANFIIAERGATAADVLHLVEMIRERIRQRTGIQLELEMDVW